MNSAHERATIRKPVIHHVHELQKRLTWALLALLAGGLIAYGVNGWLLDVIQRPLGQTLYYTSPMGGFSFLLKLCLSVGFVLALPIILYQVFAFLGPLLTRKHRLTIVAYTLWSFDLAYAGILFAYFISMPSALHFLAQFGGEHIQSLITVDEYFSFALAYLAGFAIMFQIPLIILFINKIKPLRPSKMLGVQRYVILFSYIAAAILTPTPDPLNQTIMALPAVVLYQVGVVLVWLANRPRRTKRATTAHALAQKPTKRTVVDVRPLPVATRELRPALSLHAATLRPAVPRQDLARPSIPVSTAIAAQKRPSGRRMMDIIPPQTSVRRQSTAAQKQLTTLDSVLPRPIQVGA